MLEQILRSFFPNFDPKHTKIHLASHSGDSDLLIDTVFLT